MKLTVLGFLAISASASMSSDAVQHVSDNKRALRDLKEHTGHQKKSKAAKPRLNEPSMDMASKATKAPDSMKTQTSGDSKNMMAEATTMAETSLMSMQSNLLAPTSLAPTTMAPTTIAPSIEVVSAKAVDVIPACPPAYDVAKTDYVGGDLVTMTDNIFECHSLYVMYCNIGDWDDAMLDQDANAMKMWSDAWVHVGPCSVLAEAVVPVPTSLPAAAVVPEPTSLPPTFSPTLSPTLSPTFSPTLSPTIPPSPSEVVVSEPKSLPTFSPTLAPSIEVEATQAADVIPSCPPAYDITKTDYAGGDIVTVNGNVFECHSLYVMYCNIGEWNDTLLAQDENAEEMWDDAWIHIERCV